MASCVFIVLLIIISGEVFDAAGKAKFHIFGTWDEKIHRDSVSGKLLFSQLVATHLVL